VLLEKCNSAVQEYIRNFYSTIASKNTTKVGAEQKDYLTIEVPSYSYLSLDKFKYIYAEKYYSSLLIFEI